MNGQLENTIGKAGLDGVDHDKTGQRLGQRLSQKNPPTSRARSLRACAAVMQDIGMLYLTHS